MYEAVQDRLKFIFEEFENILISFSGGKDSTVCLNLCYDYAKRTGQTDKLAFFYSDYEAEYQHTYDFVERVFAGYPEVKRRYWFCLPISAMCSVNQDQTMWTPWNEDEKDKWVRPMPQNPYVITMENCPYPFVKGTYGNTMNEDFARWFGDTYGKTASIVGIRCDESQHRTHILCSDIRVSMYKSARYSKISGKNTVTFYPIYDWTYSDVWHYISSENLEYNPLYDLMWKIGAKTREMRVASPFVIAGQTHLSWYKRIEPENWSRAVLRVSGANYAAIYAGTMALPTMRTIEKPPQMSWKEYGEFLIETTPSAVKDKIKLPEGYDINWKWLCVAILRGKYYDMKQYVKKSDKKNPEELKNKWRNLMRGN